MPDWKRLMTGRPSHEECNVQAWPHPSDNGPGVKPEHERTTANLAGRIHHNYDAPTSGGAHAAENESDPGHYTPPVLNPQRAAVDATAAADATNPPEHDLCPTCSRPIPTVGELMSDVFGRVGTRTTAFVIDFYGRVVAERPDLARMFPPDLVDPDSDPTGRGATQREKLLNALLAVASLYNPRNARAMDQLNHALDGMAATHGESRLYVEDDDWPGGRRPLLQAEYDLVNRHAVGTCRDYYGDGWTPLHHAAMWTALTYVANRMGATQILAAPRHAQG